MSRTNFAWNPESPESSVSTDASTQGLRRAGGAVELRGQSAPRYLSYGRRRGALDEAHAPDNNEFVRQIVSAFVVLLLVLAVSAAAWADCVGGQPNAHARMACCAMMHHQCGRGNADDCCNKMKETGPSSNVATAAVAKVKIVPVVVDAPAVLPSALSTLTSSSAAASVTAFIRPHDPPHLHPFPLLI